MAENSKIQWTGATWNPFWGCEKVSKGCKYCYAERLIQGRFKRPFRDVVKTGPATFKFPLKHSKKFTGKEPFTERLVFTCSLSDFFIAQGDEFRPELWEMIRATPNLIYQILTKRPERVEQNLPSDWGDGYPNVWLGVSAENQKVFDDRVGILQGIPAKVRFVSVEPILSEVRLTRPVDWVIIGGESGGKGKFRPSNLSWYQNLTDQCLAYGIPIFVKQLGTDLAIKRGMSDFAGGILEEFPETLRVRQWPKIYTSEENLVL